MKVKFNIVERLNLLGVLPKEGNFVTLKILDEFRKELSFTEEEIAKQGIVVREGQVAWKQDFEREYEIRPVALKSITEELKRLNDGSKLTYGLISVYEKCEVNGDKEVK